MNPRAFTAMLVMVLATLTVAYLGNSFLLVFLGCVLALGFVAVVAVKIFASPPAPALAARPAGPAIPAPLPAPGLGAMAKWPTPDRIFEDMVLGADATPPPDVDPDTGELLGDRVCRIEEVLTGMERTIEQLGNLIGEQSNLMANGLLELRRRVDAVTPAPEQQQLPLRQAS